MFKLSLNCLFIFLGFFGIMNVYGQNSDFSASVNSQCPGNLFTLTAADNSMSSYTWNITEQGGATQNYNVNPVAFVLDNPGQYDITLTVSDGVGSSSTTEISFLEVFDVPTIDYTITAAPYCTPAAVDFTSNSTPGSGTIISYQSFTDGTAYTTANFQHTYNSPGTYPVNISIENSNSCITSLDLSDIVVTDVPSLTSPLNPNTICSGTNFNYTPTSSIPGSTFSWVRLPSAEIIEAPSNGIGNISEVLTSSSLTNVAVSYEVTTISPGGCENTQTVVLTVQSLPVITVDDAVLCTGLSTTLTANPSQGGGSYSWSPSGSSQTITVNSPGTYTVTYAIGICSSDPVNAEVTEVAPPSITGISFTETSGLFNDDGIMCAGLDNVTLTAAASTGTGTYLWSQGGTNNSITVSPNSTTSYSVTYTDGGCESAPFSATVSVNNLPSNNYTSTITNACNSPVTTEYSSTSLGNIVWDFPGGTPNNGVGQGPISVTYNTAGIYDISMTNTNGNGCIRETDFPNAIVVGNGFPPTSSFITTTPTPQCLDGNSFCFDYTGNGADTVEWDFGDGSPTQLADQNATICHTYSALGNFNVTIIPYSTVEDVLGCSGISSQLAVEVLGPIASFDVSAVECDNQKTRTYLSTSQGTSPSTTYSWDFDDPPGLPLTGDANPTYEFSDFSPTTSSPFVVTLTVEDPATGCPPSVASQNIYAFPNNLADYGSYTTSAGTTSTDSVCLGSSLWFINQTPIPQGATNPNYTQWDWNTVNGYTWQTNGEFTGSPEEHFFSENASTASGGQTYAPGTYEIAMRAIRRNPPTGPGVQCYDTVVHNIVVLGITGGFSIPDTVCAGESFNAIDASLSPLSTIISREWDFDNDGIIDLAGNDANPSHVFNIGASGVGQEYTISLTVTDATDCSKTTTETIWVRQPIASFEVNRDFICDDQTVTVTSVANSTFSDATYSWLANTNVSPSTYVNTDNSDIIPPPFLFNDQGNNTITLTETDNLGCSDDTTIAISVFNVFAAATGTPNVATCFNPPSVVTFNNLSGNNVDPTSYQWYFGNGETSTEANPSTIYSLPGTFEVSLVVSSLTGGCSDSAVVETIDIGGPFGSISVTNPVLEGCSCYEANIDITTNDVAEATLLFGDGSFENLTINTTETITHQYCNTGTSSQNLTPILFISSGICNGNIPATQTITIHPIPGASNPGDFEYCEGENTTPITFTSPVPNTTLTWINNNPSIGLGANGNGNIASFTAATIGLLDNIANIDVTPSVNVTGCVGPTESFQITIKNTTTADAGGPSDVICEGDAVNLNGSFGGDASSAQWSSSGTGTFSPNTLDLNSVYTPSNDDISAGNVTLTLTTDDPIGPCPANDSDITITINAAVIVNAGSDVTICSNDVFTTQGSIGGSATDSEWNTSGTGVFNFPSAPITTYTPSPADILAGSVILTISTDDPGGPCDQSSSSMTLSFSNAATLNVITPVESCIGNDVSLTATIGGAASSASWSTTGAGMFDNITNLNAIYTPDAADLANGSVTLTLTTDDPIGPCSAESSSLVITFIELPTASAGLNQDVCSGETVNLSGIIGGSASQGTWSSAGSGSFTPNELTLNGQYNPSAADIASGSILLTLTTDDPSGVCGTVSSEMTINLFDFAVADAGVPQSICSAQNADLGGTIGGSATSVIWTTSGDGNFTPDANTLNATYIPGVNDQNSGFVTLIMTTNDPVGPCPAVSSDIEISISVVAVVDAGSDFTVCAGADAQLNGSVSGAVITGIWSGGSGTISNPADLNATYTPTAAELAAGSVILTLTSEDPVGPCGTESADVLVSFTSSAIVSAGAPQTICEGEDVLLNGAVGGSAVSGSWSGGTGIFVPNANDLNAVYIPSATDIAIGSLELILTTNNPAGPCEEATDTLFITINPSPFISSNANVEVCSGVSVNYSITSDVSATFSWLAQNDNVDVTGESLTIQNSSGITDVLVNNSLNTQSVDYLVSATALGSGCTNNNQLVTINVSPVVTMDTPTNQILCVGENTADIFFSSSFGGISYEWTNTNNEIGLALIGSSDITTFPAENSTAIVQTGVVTVTPLNNGCPGVPAVFEITVNPSSTVNDPGAIVECDGAPTAGIIFTGSDASITYNWTNTNPGIGLPASGTGDISSFIATNTTNNPIQSTVTVVPELNGCDGASQTFTINVDPSPDMVIPTDQNICVNNNSSAVIFTSNVIGTSYNWTNDNIGIGLGINGSGDIPSFTTINNGSQMDTATITIVPTFNGCSGPEVLFDFIVNPVLEVNEILDTILCANEEFPGIIFEGNVPNANYTWTNNNTSIGLGPNGIGDIVNFTTVNSGTVDQIATITVSPELLGCDGLESQFTITVKPVPTVSVLPLSQTVCHNQSTTPVEFSGNILTAVYEWANTNISIGIGSPGFDDIPSFIGTNTSLVSETGTFVVTPSHNGCIGASEEFSITVNPTPTVFPIPSQVLCANFATIPVIFDGDFGSVATYNWTNSNISIGLPESGFGNIGSFVVENTTAVEQTSTITVIPSINGCEGTPEVFTIMVKPTPTLVGPIPNQSLCVNTESDSVVFTGNLPEVTNYEWVNDNVAIGLVDEGVGTIPAFIAQNTGNTVIQATITVTPELNGCSGTSEQFTITTVDPVPVVFDPLDQILCAGIDTDPVVFTGPVPGTIFNWTNTNTSIGLSGQSTGDIAAFVSENTSLVDQTATITVVPDFDGCEGEPQTFTITVKPTPAVVIAPETQTLCSGQLTQEVDFSEDLIGTTYEWTNDNVSINLDPSGNGNTTPFIVENLGLNTQVATISVTPIFNECVGVADTALIIVNPISTVIIAPGVDEYCHGETTTEYTFDSNNLGTQYSWTNSNSSIGLSENGIGNIAPFVVSNTSLENQLATITVQPELNGCEGTAQIVQIVVKPIPTVDQVPNQNICANDMTDGIVFDGNLPDSTNYGWTHANVSIGLVSNGNGNIPSFTATNFSSDVQETDITVTPSLNGCFGTTMTTNITVNPISTVNTVNDTVCSGEIVPQINFTGTNPIATYTWENFNNSIGLANSGNDSIISFTAENLGTTIQTAMIVVTPDVNGCPGIDDTLEIVVNPLPIIEPISDYEYCSEEFSSPIIFNGNMPGNVYNWSSSNSAIGLNGSAQGDIPPFQTSNTGLGGLIGTITVIPEANGCNGGSETFTITVHPLPDVEAGIDTTLCFEQSITLTATGANNYQWDNGVINGVEFFPNSTEVYYVVGTDTNLCQNTDSVIVTYTLDLPPTVNAGADTAICIGQDIILAATGDAILYLWNNDVLDGEAFVPSETNEYVVIGTAANGCIESDTVEVVVNPLPVISAFASDDFICAGESTLVWGEGADTYVWDLSVIDSVEFVPSMTETYTVVGFHINGCTDTTDIEVIVNPLPDVLFSTDMTFGGCLPFEPTFTDLTSGPESNSVMWYFGNGATSTQLGSVLNTYDSYGCYDVTLVSTTAEGCTDSLTQQNFVCVNEVNAEFQPDVYEQSVVNPIFEFTNNSTNATSFEWFFGDGSESDFVNTTHFYNDYGNYVVSLVATAQDGCTDTAYVAITVIDEVLFYVPNSFTPNGDGKNEVFIPVLTAGYDRERGYEFRIYNRWGEQVFFSDVPGEGWDGSYIDPTGAVKTVQNGSYIWYVKFKDSMNNEIYDFNGHVNVIR